MAATAVFGPEMEWVAPMIHADAQRVRALYVGMAQLDNSSGQRSGSKPARQVNTRAKAALMIAVDRHRKQGAASQAFYDKKRTAGKTHNQAIRALGRHLIRVLWAMLNHDRDYELREPTTGSEQAA